MSDSAKALSDDDLFAALVQIKHFTPMLAQAIADHIGVRAKEMQDLAAECAALRSQLVEAKQEDERLTAEVFRLGIELGEAEALLTEVRDEGLDYWRDKDRAARIDAHLLRTDEGERT